MFYNIFEAKVAPFGPGKYRADRLKISNVRAKKVNRF